MMTIPRHRYALPAVIVLAGVLLGAARVAAPVAVAAPARKGPPRIVILGDSVARGAGDETGKGIAGHLGDIATERRLSWPPVVNLARDGADTSDVIDRLEDDEVQSAVRAATAVVISIGGNDLFGSPHAQIRSIVVPDISIAKTLDAIDVIVARIHRINPSAQVLLLGLYDPYRSGPRGRFARENGALWDSRMIQRFSRNPKVTVVRISDLLDSDDRISAQDDFHPSGTGYRAVADRIASSLL